MKKILISHGFHRYYPDEIFEDAFECIYFNDQNHPFEIITDPQSGQNLSYEGKNIQKNGIPAIPPLVYTKQKNGEIKKALLTHESQVIAINEISYFIPFITVDHYDRRMSFLRFIESHNIKCIETSEAFSACMDKVKSYNIFIKNNIPTPASLIIKTSEGNRAASMHDMLSFYNTHNGHVLIKPAVSRVGIGIKIPSNIKDYIDTIERLQKESVDFIVQKKISTDKPLHHLRIAISYNNIIAAQKFIADEAYQTSHVGQHKSVTDIKLSEEHIQLCIKASQALKVNSCSLDCLLSKEGEFFILEANILPAISDFYPNQAKTMALNMLKHMDS